MDQGEFEKFSVTLTFKNCHERRDGVRARRVQAWVHHNRIMSAEVRCGECD